MEHIGIDLGSKHSHVVVLSAEGKEVCRKRVEMGRMEAWLKLQKKGQVVMEACTQSTAVAAMASDAGHGVKVVPAQFVRALGVGARGIKTDDRDAMALAQASLRHPDLPSVHLRRAISMERSKLMKARVLLVRNRGSLVLHIKSFFRARLQVMSGRMTPKGFVDAAQALGTAHEEGLPMYIEALLASFTALSEQIDALDEEIERVCSQDEDVKRLQTVPGVGPKISLAFVAQVDDPGRFRSAEALCSYLALVPGESTTGGKIVRTGTIKAGPVYLKSLLVQGAWVMWRSRPNDPIVLWAKRISEKRNSQVAIMALARKLAGILWAMWRDKSDYDPTQPVHRGKSKNSPANEPETQNTAAATRAA